MTIWTCRAVLLLLLLGGTSCARRLTVSDVAGVYTVKLPGGIEELTLDLNEQFHQIIRIESRRETYLATGKWTFDGGQNEVVFDGNFLIALDARGNLLPNIHAETNRVVVLGVDYSFGSMSIFASDNQVYKKVKSK